MSSGTSAERRDRGHAQRRCPGRQSRRVLTLDDQADGLTLEQVVAARFDKRSN
ncbi:hypothetical protein ACFPA8_03865 [Streptomyces ovatisporus]|uniref:Transposase n=1 Tax=Streptomyces ovatisporus TaxID=1128682 RepID=A0ABV9A0R4_9ACTN